MTRINSSTLEFPDELEHPMEEWKGQRPVPRLTLTIAEAAYACGVSERTFRNRVLPDIRVVHVSDRILLVRIKELDKWLEKHQGTYPFTDDEWRDIAALRSYD